MIERKVAGTFNAEASDFGFGDLEKEDALASGLCGDGDGDGLEAFFVISAFKGGASAFHIGFGAAGTEEGIDGFADFFLIEEMRTEHPIFGDVKATCTWASGGRRGSGGGWGGDLGIGGGSVERSEQRRGAEKREERPGPSGEIDSTKTW